MTKKVKLLVSRSGSDGSYKPGDVISVDGDEAVRMLNAGQCTLVDEPEVRTAAKKTAKTTTKRKVASKKTAPEA